MRFAGIFLVVLLAFLSFLVSISEARFGDHRGVSTGSSELEVEQLEAVFTSF